jgi:hypothetical protein
VNAVHRYRIACRFRGQEYVLDEARAFVLGAVAMAAGPADYSTAPEDERRFDVEVFVQGPLVDGFRDRLQLVVNHVLPRMLAEQGTTVEIGAPELVETIDAEATP